MNSLAALAMMYALMTAGSASILFISFKGRVDVSGSYFLLAELMMPFAAGGIILSNLDTSYQTSTVFFTTNFLSLLSEISIIFSLHSLCRHVKISHYILAACGIAIYCGLIELSRELSGSRLPVGLFGFISAILAFWTYRICKSTPDETLKSNQFLGWMANLEIGIGLFALMRILSCFSSAPINPRSPTVVATLLYATFLVLNMFRYISYQSLRISWVDPRSRVYNPLNKNLAQAIEEKDNLLRGLIASNRVIGISALASSLSHQLSQPLTAIGLQTETLKRDLIKSGKDEEAVAALDKISLQLGKLSSLVKNLRQLFNARGYKFNEVELQGISNEVLELIEPTLNTKKIHLSKIFLANPLVLGDTIQIQQVLINLFNNAIDAISSANPALREIRLTINSDEKWASISMEDTGAGIDANVLPAIFELYKTTKAEGLGVGLWLSKTIMDKHHGTITCANRQEGGAIFTVKIPLAEKKS